MITEGQFIIGVTLIYWITFIILWRKACDEAIDWVFNIFLNLLLSVFLMFGTLSLDVKEQRINYEYYCKIQSLKNSNDIQGSFVLGTGSVEQVEYYYYYFKDINGYFRRGKKQVENTVIEERGGTPHIERKYIKRVSITGIVKSYKDQPSEEYKIVVPKGTVINKFEVY